MKKRFLSLALSLSLAVSLFVPALAAGTDPVTPTAPEWIDEEDYLIFPGDMLYSPENEAEENWEKILSLREEAKAGAKTIDAPEIGWSVGTTAYRYEVGLVWLKCAENAGITSATARRALSAAANAFSSAASSWKNLYVEEPDELYCLLGVYRLRARLLIDKTDLAGVLMDWAMTYLGMTVSDIYDAPHMELVKPETRFRAENDLNEYLFKKGRPIPPSAEGYVQIFLDNSYVSVDVPAIITNSGRTTIPIRAVAEALGAEVGWEDSTRQVTLTRAGTSIVMTIDSTTALVNEEPVEMDTAPYVSPEGRTMIPVRYVAEFFGQKVDWNGDDRRVFITEDKSVAGDSNLESWAVPMGMMLHWINVGYVPELFGGQIRTAEAVADCRDSLSSGWNISSREQLVNTVFSMTLSGHNATFREMAADVKERSEADRKAISETSGAWPYFMWEYTEQLDKKWGDRGILAWDLFRMSNLVQWGYTAGYITYEEALTLLEPAALLLFTNFSSWDEAYENYVDGYTWWARTNAQEWAAKKVPFLKETFGDRIKEYETQNGWQNWMEQPRGSYYFEMKTSERAGHFFDDSLFEAGVIGLPEE